MKGLLKDYLFTKHILVSDGAMSIGPEQRSDAFAVIVALAKKFSIRITKGAEIACEQIIEDAAHNLGVYVPEPFYRGFPQSVRELTSEQLLFDQLSHYTQTYGMGWFDEAGHSIIEQVYERIGFNEHSEPKDFEILSEVEATTKLKEYLKGLMSGNRPLNNDQWLILADGWEAFGKDILPEKIPCKDTAVRFLYATKDLDFCRYLRLSDTIKLLQYIQYTQYGSEKLNKLNLRNQDRKFLTKVIDWFDLADAIDLEDDLPKPVYCDYTVCFEKRRIWCGLFHHLHYKPKLEVGLMDRFIHDVRNGKNFSTYHLFEEYMRKGEYKAAANVLGTFKGNSDLIRHLNYILSRCDEHEMEEVLKCLE